MKEAETLAVQLRSGALPVTLHLAEKRTVGPILGSDSLEKSIKAGIIGLLMILIFMVGYYRLPGVVADISLVLYGVLVLGIMSLLGFVLTLPGIAGFILSIGMAVDANIIIYERLKDELRHGKTLRAAVDSGFRRAFWTIFDANITTLIAALVLMYFGVGPIKGFAVTLTIGILCSMFTAVVFTRWLLKWTADSVKIPGTMEFRGSKMRIIENRKWFYLLSLLVLIPGLISLCWPGRGLNQGIDFTGGSMLHIAFEQPVQVKEVRDVLAEFDTKKAPYRRAARGVLFALICCSRKRAIISSAFNEKIGPVKIMRNGDWAGNR